MSMSPQIVLYVFWKYISEYLTETLYREFKPHDCGCIFLKEPYLAVSLLLRYDRSIYNNLVEDMVNSYSMRQDNYPRTLYKMQQIFINRQNIPRTTTRTPTGSLALPQERTNNEVTSPTNNGHSRRQRRIEQDIYTVKCYNCNPYGHYSID